MNPAVGWLLAGLGLGLIVGFSVLVLRTRVLAAAWAAERALVEQERGFMASRMAQLQAEIDASTQQLQGLHLTNTLQLQNLATQQEAVQNARAQLQDTQARCQLGELELQAQRLRVEELATENSRLMSTQLERDTQHQKQVLQLEEQRRLLTQEFQNIANRIFEEKGQHFAQSSKQALEQLLTPFREQMSEFRQRVDTIHKENNEAASSLTTQLLHIKDLNKQMTADAQNLTRALKGDKKLTGNWGEVQLEKSLQLAGLVAGEHYQREAVFDAPEGGNKLPDFVLKLPDGKHLVLDSKVSLVDYDAALASETEAAQLLLLDAHVRAVKKHVDQLAQRDYTNLIGIRSPNFVLMFMPVEPAYIEALKHAKDLFNYGFDKNVILVSHTTLMPILRTVANLWMIERGNVEAKEISARAGEIFNHLCLVAERLHKLGKTLSAANNHYNDTVRAMTGNQGLYGKVERFKDLASNVTKQLPNLEPSYQDVEYKKLEPALGPMDDELREAPLDPEVGCEKPVEASCITA